MRGAHLEVVVVQQLAHLEGNEARTVTNGIVAATRDNGPFVALGKIGKPSVVKHLANGCDNVEGAGALGDEADKLA